VYGPISFLTDFLVKYLGSKRFAPTTEAGDTPASFALLAFRAAISENQ